MSKRPGKIHDFFPCFVVVSVVLANTTIFAKMNTTLP